jgi:hypothetical protein
LPCGRGCPAAGHAVCRPVSAVRVSVRWVGGRAGVRCPRVRCPSVGVHASGRPVDGRPLSRPLHLRCAHRGGSWDASVRRAAHVGTHRVRRVAVVASGLGRLPRGALARKELAVRGSHTCRRQTCRRLGCAQAAAPPSAPGRPRVRVQREGAGRLAGERVREQVFTSPPAGAAWAGGRRGRSTTRLNREVVTTLRGRCVGAGPASSRSGRLSGSTGSRPRPRCGRGM